MEDIYKVQ